MEIRTLEQFKSELWDSWSEEERLNICYEVGKQLCELEEKLKVLKRDMESLNEIFEEKEDDY